MADVVINHQTIVNPDWSALYLEFKNILLKRFSVSDFSAVKALLGSQTRGDRKPSVYLRHLRSLIADRGIDCEVIIKETFLNNLPPQVVSALMGRPVGDTLEVMAGVADTILERIAPQPVYSLTDYSHYQPNMNALSLPPNFNPVSAVISNAPPPLSAHERAMSSQMADIAAAISTLTAEMSALKAENTRITRSASRDRSNTERNRAPSKSPVRRPARVPVHNDPEFCWYHNEFGGKAKRCNEPCIWVSKTGGKAIVVNQVSSAPINSAPAQPAFTLADIGSMMSQVINQSLANFAAGNSNAPQ